MSARSRVSIAIPTFVTLALALAACSGSASKQSEPTTKREPAPSTTTAAPTTRATTTTSASAFTRAPHPVPPAACLHLSEPGGAPAPDTFIESAHDGRGRVTVSRIDTGQAVQVLGSSCASRGGDVRYAMRVADGTLLIAGRDTIPRAKYWTDGAYFHDTTYRKTYPGDSAAVSPDGQRIVTLVVSGSDSQILRQYDATTGSIVSHLLAVPPTSVQQRTQQGQAGKVLGFTWTADGQSLVVAMERGFAAPGGLYVVPASSASLPPEPTVPLATNAPQPTTTFTSPAALANGHIVAFEYLAPVQRNGWMGAVVDIDPTTKVVRTVIGSTENAFDAPPCEDIAPGTSVPAFVPRCRMLGPGQIDADDDLALLTDAAGIVWLYDGSTVRRVSQSTGNIAHW